MIFLFVTLLIGNINHSYANIDSTYLIRLHDLTHLVFLYPTRLKDEVFGQYYSPQRKSNS